MGKLFKQSKSCDFFSQFSVSRNILHHHPHILVALRLKILTFPRSLKKKKKKRSQVGTKLNHPLLLTAECCYGDTNLSKREVHGIFAILARGIFRT